MPEKTTFDVIDVLTRAGDARDALLTLLDDEAINLDAHLVSDVLRATGRVGAALETRPALVGLCSVLRAIDAALSGQIGLDELRSGIELQAARTDGFAAFHDARILLRTLDEVLEPNRIEHDARATRSQVELLHRELQEWMVDELVGATQVDTPIEPTDTRDPRAAFAVTDPELRQVAHDLVDELLHGARHHPVTGLAGAAWRRDWSAVPVAGERFGEDPDEVARFAEAVTEQLPGATHVLQVDRHLPARWMIEGRTIVVGDGLRSSWLLPATPGGFALATIERRSRSVLTTRDLDVALVEGVDHHALLGPAAFVEQALGMPPLHAIARFREHVEALAELDDGDPPAHLLDVATNFGRLRRRSR
ncbi:MAG: hypothetical protein JWL76_1523 [Thermoleophilia bacterium]|nr:hypothetical protein [Thermoleophilia bacterium]